MEESMKVESPAELKAAFEVWRKKKRHVREAVPRELLERVRRAIDVHGLGEVARATKIDRRRLIQRRAGLARHTEHAAPLPSFSRVELSAPTAAGRPLAVLETPVGLKLQIFTQTEAMLGLLASLCATGGAR